MTETRVVAEGMRRRRVCGSCKRRFTTYEKVGAPGLKVRKRDGRQELFDSEKLVRLIQRLSRHRGTLSLDDARRLARDLEASALDGGRKSIAWHEIVELLLVRVRVRDATVARYLEANYLNEHGQLQFDTTHPPPTLQQLPLPGVDDEP